MAASSRPAFPLAPVLLVMSAWTVLWWGIIGLLVVPVLPGGALAIVAAALLGLVPLAVLVRGIRGGRYPGKWTRLLALRPFWYLQLALPVVGGAGLVGAIAGLPFGAAGTAGRWAVALAAGVYATAMVAGWLGSKRLLVRHLDVQLDDLDPALEGLRIAQLTDLHVGPHTSTRFLARVAGAVRAARPDLIAITGDQVDDYAQDVTLFARAFGDLRAPLGVFAVAGNHDVYAGWPAVREGMERAGMTVLVNDAVHRVHNGVPLWIAGTGDPAGTRGGARTAAPDVARTMARVTPDTLSIVLAHNPALWPALARRGARLTLSGHTHHGQLSIPSLGWSLASPFLEHAMGVHRDGDALLYIAPGTNYWGIPFRLGAFPEVTVLTLRRGERAGIVEKDVEGCGVRRVA